MWYISQNVRKHISEALKLPYFEYEFNNCISSYTLEEECFLGGKRFLKIANFGKTHNSMLYITCETSGQPFSVKVSILLKQTADAYTSTIFKLLQEESHRCQSLAVKETANNEITFKFKITYEGHRYNFVEFNFLKLKVTCSWKKY